jgi:restriction system protein
VPVQRSYPVRELAAGLRQAAGIDETAGRAGPGANGRGVPTCPLCGRLMTLRTVARPGPYEGKQFWACADYPQCHGVREYRAVR